MFLRAIGVIFSEHFLRYWRASFGYHVRMKTLKLLLVLLFAAALSACGDDAQAKCDVDTPAELDEDGELDEDEEPNEEQEEGDEPAPEDCDDVDDGEGDGDEDEDDILASWPNDAALQEAEVLRLINLERAAGATCRGNAMAPVSPVQFDERIVSAARLHSFDMMSNDYFSHQSLDGSGPRERMAAQGFSGSGWAENIAMGQRDAQAAVSSWMSSTQGHCENIMSSSYNVIGVGYAAPYWTLKLGAAR